MTYLYSESTTSATEKKMEWKKFFDGVEGHVVKNWPVEDAYKPTYSTDGKINLRKFDEEQLITLITRIEEGTITFSKTK